MGLANSQVNKVHKPLECIGLNVWYQIVPEDSMQDLKYCPTARMHIYKFTNEVKVEKASERTIVILLDSKFLREWAVR